MVEASLYTLTEAAAVLGVPPATVAELVTRHGLPAIWVPAVYPADARQLRIRPADLDTWRRTTTATRQSP